ncbi:MAG: amidohydrolase [Syntrophobacteraceae bacterium]|nr:amidohydrolase [Syntrophobacteraceae bacterium]
MPAPSPASYGPELEPRPVEEVDWLLLNADAVVTCDEAMRTIGVGAVAIQADRLAAVGPSEELARRYRGRRNLDLRGYLLMPGLVNTHTHAAMSCFRGLGDDLPLDRWLHEVIFPAERVSVTPEMVYWGTLLSCLEMLGNGITTFCDGYFFEESAALAARDAGMRAVLGQGILDHPTPDHPDPSTARTRAEAFLESFPDVGDRVRPSLFCHAPYTCGPSTLRWVKDLCRERDILFQVHVSETEWEARAIQEMYGMGPIPHLDVLGVWDDRTLAAHAVWIDGDDARLLADRGAAVSHNPSSNMKLASGVAPLPVLMEAGVTLGLGTDSCASNNGLDLFREMDLTAKLHKVSRLDPLACPARRVLRMATVGGAAALGWRGRIGSLEAGMKADLIALDIRQPHLTPMYDGASHLVYATRGSDVRYAWVDGRLLLEGGRFKETDAVRAMAEVRKMALTLAKRRGG